MSKIEFLYPLNGLFIFVVIGIVMLYLQGMKKKRKILKVFKLSYNQYKMFLRMMSMIFGLILVVIALMGPVKENGVTEVNIKGLDIYVLIDTSKSMLTEDILPSRIQRAKQTIDQLLVNLEGDRVGFIPFSSTAYVQMPLSDDYQLASMFMEVVDTDMISGGGTDLAKALSLAVDSFEISSVGDKVIVVLSDGEEHDPEALAYVDKLEDQQIKIFSIGMGTLEGGLIPLYDQSGTQKIGYKKDDSGQTIMSKLNEEVLREIGLKTGGNYYRSSEDSGEIKALITEIGKLKKGTLQSRKVKEYLQLYQYFLALGLVLLFISFTLPERRLTHE